MRRQAAAQEKERKEVKSIEGKRKATRSSRPARHTILFFKENESILFLFFYLFRSETS